MILPIVKMGPAPLNVLSPEYQAHQSAARRADAHNKVARGLKGLHASLNPYRDQAIRIGGQTINVLARRSGDLVVGDSQWTVEISADNKPLIRAGSVIYKSVADLTPATVTNYDAVTGWTHSSALTNEDCVCFKLTTDENAVITEIALDVRNATEDGFYTITSVPAPDPDFLGTMWLPIARIVLAGDAWAVEAQFINGPVRLRYAAWEEYLGYMTT